MNCELGRTNTGQYFHRVTFKSPINDHIPINSERYLTIRNADNTYTVAYELIHTNCLFALSDIGSHTSNKIIYYVIEQLCGYFYMLHCHKIINKIFENREKKDKIKLFCENICTITADYMLTFLFRHYSNNGLKPQNNTIYKRQSLNLVDIIISIFYRDTKNTTSANPCLLAKCKFKNKIQYFNNFNNYSLFHQIFCTDLTTNAKATKQEIKILLFYKLIEEFANTLANNFRQLLQ